MTEEIKEEAPAVEEKAAAMGHMSKEEWEAKGRDPEKWRPAAEFVERGENLMPILKERLEKQTREMTEMKQTMQQLHSHFTQAEAVAEQRGWERAINSVTQKQRAAAEIADVEEFDKLEIERRRLLSEPPRPHVPQGPSPEYREFHKKNDWYTEDEEMTVYADAIGTRFAQKNPHLTLTDVYAEVERKVRGRFPEKFTNPRREGASSVESATPSPVKKSGKTFDDLPASAKEAYAKFAKQIPNYKKEDYLKHYQWDK